MHRRSLSAGTVGLAMLLVMLGGTPDAMGQGTSRRFPAPMTYEQMRDLLVPLRLSDEQHAVADAAHARYLAGLLELRHGRIRRHLAEYGSAQLAFAGDRDLIVDATRDRRAILAEIRRREQAFFADLAPALSEPQGAALPRLIERRERARLSGYTVTEGPGQWGLPRLSRIDLVPYLEDVEIPADMRERVDERVAVYEAGLTPAYRTIHDRRLGLELEFHDHTFAKRQAFEQRMRALKDGADLETPEGREAYARAVEGALEENPANAAFDVELPGHDDIRRGFVRISRSNRELLDDLGGLIGTEPVERLERRYMRRAMATLGTPRDPLERRVERFLGGDPAPDPEIAAAVDELYRGYTVQRRKLVRKLVSAGEDAAFRHTGTAFILAPTPGPEGAADQEDDVEKARSSIQDLDRSTLQRYAALTGEEIDLGAVGRAMTLGGIELIAPGDGEGVTLELQGLGGEVATGVISLVIEPGTGVIEGGSGGAIMISGIQLGDGAGGNIVFEGLPGGPGHGSWLPGPMERSHVDDLCESIGLDESMRGVVDSLYEDYRAAFRSLDEQVIRPAREAVRSVSRGPATDPQGTIDAFADVRAAMESIIALDRKLLDDVSAVVGDEQAVTSVLRTRQRYAFGHVGLVATHGRSGSREHATDLMAVSREVTASLAGGEAALAAYDERSVPLFAGRWRTSLDAAAEAARATAEKASRGGDDLADFIIPEPADSAEVCSAESALRELNRSTLDQLRAGMGAAGFHAVQEAYRRRAFPSIYRERDTLDALLRQAVALELSAETKRRLDEICFGYRNEHAALCDRMVDRTRAFDREAAALGGGDDQAAFERFRRFQQEIAADRFERQNLNQRTQQALIDLLDEPSRRRLGLADQGS